MKVSPLTKRAQAYGMRAQRAARQLAQLSSEKKNSLLEAIASELEKSRTQILRANIKDLRAAQKEHMSSGNLDRLALHESRLTALIASVRSVVALPDPVGNVIESRTVPSGLKLSRVRVPLGVICMIYEARPNVTIDAAVLCIKSGNAVILKGGSEADATNTALVGCVRRALQKSKLADSIQLIAKKERAILGELLKMHQYIDVVIPRGSARLIEFVRENARVPIIITGASVVHTYVDSEADIPKAVEIVMNAKLRRLSICNTLDTLLLHKNIAAKFLEKYIAALPHNPYKAYKIELRADMQSYKIIQKNIKKTVGQKKADFNITVRKAKTEDYACEFLDAILAIKVVADVDAALAHIQVHSLKHSEAIITQNPATAQRFLREVDAACVYVNASTQFSDGGEFGLGAEIGISTQKLHVRGPFALEGLTTYTWHIEGSGQIRKA